MTSLTSTGSRSTLATAEPTDLHSTGESSENEYSRITKLLDNMSRRMSSSMEEIHGVNLQMRMLSFNSKIEAARAGDAGKAFAIVSGEIATLSDKTAQVADLLGHDASKSIDELQEISEQIATNVRGTRLSDLALTNIDLIDRNLYERSCDVRWWATDSSLVDAVDSGDSDCCRYASQRLGVILNAYTVYYDLVLCDTSGNVVANGRPDQFAISGRNQYSEPWFQQGIQSSNGDEYGFQSVHESGLLGGRRVLVYSCAVREGGRSNGRVLGVLGIFFNYDSLAQEIMNSTPIDADLKALTRVCITDDKGLVLADSEGHILSDSISFTGLKNLFKQDKSYIIAEVDGKTCCVAHANSPGYETYRTGWHSLIIQAI
jgi:archaellum component FlaC